MENNNNEQRKESFLDLLSVMTPEQMNQIIDQKGKETKQIPLVIFCK